MTRTQVEIITLADGRRFPVYQGEALAWDISLYFTPGQAPYYPKLRAVVAAMAQERPVQLQSERRTLQRACYDRLFGHVAEKLLAIIDSEEQE